MLCVISPVGLKTDVCAVWLTFIACLSVLEFFFFFFVLNLALKLSSCLR